MTGRRARLLQIAIGAVLGLLAAAVAIGVAELVAAFIRPEASPIAAVGASVVKLSPDAVTEFAKANLGTNDKTYLKTGIYVLLAVFAAVIGLVGRRWQNAGVAGIGLFGVIGVIAALAQPGSGPLDLLPSVLGAVAGMIALVLLLRFANRPSVAGPAHSERAGSEPVGAETAGTGSAEDGTASAEPVDTADRRRFLLLAAGSAAVAALAGLGGRALQGVRFQADRSRAQVKIPRPASPAKAVPEGVDLKVPGMEPWRTPNSTFYRIDTALTLPQVPADTWQLKIHGRVDHPRTISFDELLKRPLMERDITLTCVSNPVGGSYVGNARWTGVSLRDLLREVGVHSGADQIVSRSADGMTIGTPTAAVMDGRDAMLAVAMNGEPLPIKHGFPVRMVVPGLYGYVSACKWLVDLEVTTFAAYDAYWVPRGYSAKAPIKTESRIDTPKPFANLKAGAVQVGGVAWAQHRGIRKVEVQVDNGPWREARLASVPSTDTWRQWTYTWQASSGDHTLRVRATDQDGKTQTGQRVEVAPNGATGWHSISVTVA